MDILRNIEKKILNIANNNTNNASEINNLKKDIKLYLDIFDKREEIKREKKGIYDELYDNKRKAYRISYENYLSDKKDLMKDIIKEKTKGAIRKYLECKYEDEEAAVNIPDIYTYENIRLPNNREDFDMPSVPQAPQAQQAQQAKPSVPVNNKKDHMIPVKPVKPVKPIKTAKPTAKPVVAKPDEKECPEGKEINPVTKRCVNVCKDGQVRNPETGKCVASAKKTKTEPKKEPKKEPKEEPKKAEPKKAEPKKEEPKKEEPKKEPKEEPKKEEPKKAEPKKAEPKKEEPKKEEPKKEPKEEPKKEEPKKAEPKGAKEKECPEGKEINPVTKRCVNVCKDGQVRNPETGKCVGAKKK